jgi:hypothetical protein
MYKILRFHFDGTRPEVVKTGLTREEAEAHCEDPNTSSRTATSPEAVARTEARGPWFEGFTREEPTFNHRVVDGEVETW